MSVAPDVRTPAAPASPDQLSSPPLRISAERPSVLPLTLPHGTGRLASAAAASGAASLAMLATGTTAPMQAALGCITLSAILLLAAIALGMRIRVIAIVVFAVALFWLPLHPNFRAYDSAIRALLTMPAIVSLLFILLTLAGLPRAWSVRSGIVVGGLGTLLLTAWPVLTVLGLYLAIRADPPLSLVSFLCIASPLPAAWAAATAGRASALKIGVPFTLLRDAFFRVSTVASGIAAALWLGQSAQALVSRATFGSPLEGLSDAAGWVIALLGLAVSGWAVLRLPAWLTKAQLRGRVEPATVSESLLFVASSCLAALAAWRLDGTVSLGRACWIALVGAVAYAWCRLRFATPRAAPNMPLWIIMGDGTPSENVCDAAAEAAAAWRSGQVTVLAVPVWATTLGGAHLHAAVRVGRSDALVPTHAVQIEDWEDAQPDQWPTLPVRELYAPQALWSRMLRERIDATARILVLVREQSSSPAPPETDSFGRFVRTLLTVPTGQATLDDLRAAARRMFSRSAASSGVAGLLVSRSNAGDLQPDLARGRLDRMATEVLTGKGSLLQRLRELQPPPAPVVVRHIMVHCAPAGIPLAERVVRLIDGKRDAEGRAIECWIATRYPGAGVWRHLVTTQLGLWRHAAWLVGRLLESARPTTGLRRVALQLPLLLMGGRKAGEFELIVVEDIAGATPAVLPYEIVEAGVRRNVVTRLIAVRAIGGASAGQLSFPAALYKGEIRVNIGAPVDLAAEHVVEKLLTLDLLPPIKPRSAEAPRQSTRRAAAVTAVDQEKTPAAAAMTRRRFLSRLFGRKTIEDLLVVERLYALKRVLGVRDLLMLSIGAVVGAGIFSVIGVAAAGSVLANGEIVRYGAGPAVVVSFILLGGVCALAALCYAELAAMIPRAGSAYSYTYATLGEFVAWIIGWDLILEYAVGNIAVAISWSAYFKSILSGFGVILPDWLTYGYGAALASADPAAQSLVQAAPRIAGIPILLNVPAALIVLGLTVLLYRGVRESARANTLIVLVKLLVLGVFILFGATRIQLDNYTPFAPNGWRGIHQGAALVFFAYIGFDAISTAAEETKNPQRDLPIGILGGLAICTLIFVIVAAVATGVVPYTELRTADPLAHALGAAGLGTASWIVAWGAVIALTSVLLVFQYGQPRIFWAMARDGLLPQWASRIHPKYRTPHITTVATGLVVAAGALVMDELATYDLTNLGVLFAFVVVCIGVLVLRVREPDRPRPFRVPLVWVVAPLGILACVYVMAGLPAQAWARFAGWLAIGVVIYFSYGFRHSLLREGSRRG